MPLVQQADQPVQLAQQQQVQLVQAWVPQVPQATLVPRALTGQQVQLVQQVPLLTQEPQVHRVPWVIPAALVLKVHKAYKVFVVSLEIRAAQAPLALTARSQDQLVTQEPRAALANKDPLV